MLSSIRIANMALAHLGAGAIEAFSEASPEARLCALWYAPERRALLTLHDWAFARRRAVLAPLAVPAPPPWQRVYGWPVDCLVARAVNPLIAGKSPPWQVATVGEASRAILTDVTPASLAYTGDVDDPDLFAPLFAHALSWRLAVHIAPAITGGAATRALMEAAMLAERAAVTADARQGQDAPPADAEWIRARA